MGFLGSIYLMAIIFLGPFILAFIALIIGLITKNSAWKRAALWFLIIGVVLWLGYQLIYANSY